jgi:hypothetical protein
MHEENLTFEQFDCMQIKKNKTFYFEKESI